MGKFKKVIATVLSAVMAFSVMGVTAFADDKYAKNAEIKIATAEELVEAEEWSDVDFIRRRI